MTQLLPRGRSGISVFVRTREGFSGWRLALTKELKLMFITQVYPLHGKEAAAQSMLTALVLLGPVIIQFWWTQLGF